MTNTNLATTTSVTLEKNPAYFGAFLNMGMHNVYLIFNHLSENYLKKKLFSSEDKINSKDEITKLFSSLNIIEKSTYFLLLNKIFNKNFINKYKNDDEKAQEQMFADFNIPELHDKLRLILGLLDKFRNEYSHFTKSTKNNLIEPRKVDVCDSIKTILLDNLSIALNMAEKRFSFKNDKDISKYLFKENTNDITELGMIFFLSHFLERQYITNLLNLIPQEELIKDDVNLELIKNIFCIFCIKLPHDKFITTKGSTDSFILDIFDELTRCPKQLFNVLIDENKKSFKPPLKTDAIKNIKNNSLNDDIVDEDEHIENITNRHRTNTDRFHYFAIKFLDEQTNFNINFEIDVCKLIVRQYTKTIGKESHPRNIVEDIKVYEKLKKLNIDNAVTHSNDIPKNLQGIIKKIQNSKNKQGEFKFKDLDKIEDNILQYAPHYNIQDNKIKIQFGGNKQVAILSIHEIHKICLLSLLGENALIVSTLQKFCGQYYANLSKQQQLPEFAENPFEKKSINTSDVKSRKYKAKFKLDNIDVTSYEYSEEEFNSLRQRKKMVKGKNLPFKVQNHILNIASSEQNLAFHQYIKLLKNNHKKIQQKDGVLADYLAKDIIKMMTVKSDKDKASSFYYAKMQEALALYCLSEHKTNFQNIYKYLNLENSHPFLKDLNLFYSNKIQNTKDFFDSYVKIRSGNKDLKIISWFEKVFYKKGFDKNNNPTTIIELPTNKNVPISIENKYKKYQTIFNISNYVSKLKNGDKSTNIEIPPKIIQIPTGLFDDILKEELKKQSIIKEKQNLDRQAIENDKEIELQRIEDNIKKEQDKNDKSIQEMQIFNKNFKPKKTNEDIRKKYDNDFLNVEKKYKELFDKFDKENSYLNKLISSYLDNHTQDFYVKERNYQIYKQIIPFSLEDKQVKHSIDIENQSNVQNDSKIKNRCVSKIVDNEKVIRYYQTKDRILFLILQKLMQNSQMIKDADSIKLSDINSQFLEKQISYEIEIIAKEKDYLDVKKTISIDKIKIKNTTTLKKLLRDKRLRGIFSYFPNQEIEYKDVKAEIDIYNQIQPLALKKVFEFEEALISKYRNEIEIIKNSYNKKFDNIEHNPYLDFLRDKNHIKPCEYNFLLIARNKFSHNQFIDINDGFCDTLNKDVINKNISQQIFEKYAKLVDDILQKRLK